MIKYDLDLKKIDEIKDCFIAENRERGAMGKGLGTYVAALDYFDKILIVLSATRGEISIASFANIIIGTPVGVANASVTYYRNYKETI